MDSSSAHFNPVVFFEEMRVFQACTCDQRFYNLAQVPNRYCCALGALRECAYFLFHVSPTVWWYVFVRTLSAT